MICPVCNNMIPEGAAACPVCGTAAPVAQNSQSYTPYQQPDMNQQQGYNGYQQPDMNQQQGYAGYQQPAGYDQQQGYAGYQQPNGYQQQGYAGYQQPAGYDQQQGYNGYQQPNGYQQQGYAGYPQVPYQQQPYGYPPQNGYGYPPVRQPSVFGTKLVSSLKKLPGRFLKSFTNPGAVLREMVEDRDYFTAPIIVIALLLLTFFAGMLMMRGVVFTAMAIAGQPISGSEYSQLTKFISPAGFGGVAVLTQFLIMLVCTGIYVGYLCGIKKVPFTAEVVLSFLSIVNMPAVAVSLLVIVLSLIWTWLALIVVAGGFIFALCHANQLVNTLTGSTGDQDYLVRVVLICVVFLVAAIISALCSSIEVNSIVRLMSSSRFFY